MMPQHSFRNPTQDPFRTRALGVGIPYVASRHEEYREESGAHYLQGNPEDHLESPRAAYAEAYVLRDVRPLVGTGRGLSLGTAAPPCPALLEHIVKWCRASRAAWYAEHAGFSRVPHPEAAPARAPRRRPLLHGHEVYDLQVPVALPSTEEAADTLAANARVVAAAIPCPLLLQNVPSLANSPRPALTEGEFLERVLSRSGTGLRLDLTAVLSSVQRRGVPPLEGLRELPLERVVEVLITGGMPVAGALVPFRDAPVPEAAWGLLDAVLGAAPVKGVLLDRAPDARRAEELARANAAWRSAIGPIPIPAGESA